MNSVSSFVHLILLIKKVQITIVKCNIAHISKRKLRGNNFRLILKYNEK